LNIAKTELETVEEKDNLHNFERVET